VADQNISSWESLVSDVCKAVQKIFSIDYRCYTHTSNTLFMALLDFVRDYPGELAPER